MDTYLKNLTLEKLMGVINLFPWFGGARVELAERTGDFQEAVLYVCSRKLLRLKAGASSVVKDSSPKVEQLIKPSPRKVYVVGGDFFSQEDYNKLSGEEMNVLGSLPQKPAGTDGEDSGTGDFMDLCTETLARIYAEQGYNEKARDIYSKLILRYPEKNAYFAALIKSLEDSRI